MNAGETKINVFSTFTHAVLLNSNWLVHDVILLSLFHILCEVPSVPTHGFNRSIYIFIYLVSALKRKLYYLNYFTIFIQYGLKLLNLT